MPGLKPFPRFQTRGSWERDFEVFESRSRLLPKEGELWEKMTPKFENFWNSLQVLSFIAVKREPVYYLCHASWRKVRCQGGVSQIIESAGLWNAVTFDSNIKKFKGDLNQIWKSSKEYLYKIYEIPGNYKENLRKPRSKWEKLRKHKRNFREKLILVKCERNLEENQGLFKENGGTFKRKFKKFGEIWNIP